MIDTRKYAEEIVRIVQSNVNEPVDVIEGLLIALINRAKDNVV